jgi:phosphoribosylformylglycinamidine synthase
MVGLVEKPEHLTTQWFKDPGDVILLLGEMVDLADPLQGLGGSAYLQRVQGIKNGLPPRCSLEAEKELHLGLRALIHSGVVKSAHDCSDGGLAVALAESCISQQIARETPRLIGAKIDLRVHTTDDGSIQSTAQPEPRLDALLFGESQGRIIISVAPDQAPKVLAQAKILGLAATRLGTVGGEALEITTEQATFSCPVAELHDVWWNTIARVMK